LHYSAKLIKCEQEFGLILEGEPAYPGTDPVSNLFPYAVEFILGYFFWQVDS